MSESREALGIPPYEPVQPPASDPARPAGDGGRPEDRPILPLPRGPQWLRVRRRCPGAQVPAASCGVRLPLPATLRIACPSLSPAGRDRSATSSGTTYSSGQPTRRILLHGRAPVHRQGGRAQSRGLQEFPPAVRRSVHGLLPSYIIRTGCPSRLSPCGHLTGDLTAWSEGETMG